ncbi:MAG: beta-lactamase family protein, partial [bacterium]|nr:beta-lactamase family protein [bacterium]
MNPSEAGIDTTRLRRVSEVIESDLEAERYDGAVVLVARHGKIAMHEALGYAERDGGRQANTDDVFHLFSVTKTMTAIAVLRYVDRGDLQLTTPVAEIIPEFAAKGKQRITVAQLLCHRAGLPMDLPYIDPSELGNPEAVALAVADQAIYVKPGTIVSYSPIGSFAVLAEIARRVDGGSRPFRQMLDEDVFAPLGMKNTSLALREDLAARRVPVVVR